MTMAAERPAPATSARHTLDDLRDEGWLFLPAITHGDLTEMRALRVWYPGWQDLFRLRGADDAGAVRRDPAGNLIWRRDGSLTEVVAALRTLPEPPSSRWSPCQCGKS